LSRRILCNQHHAGGGFIEPVDETQAGICTQLLLQERHKVRLARTVGCCADTGGFVDYDQVGILIDDFDVIFRHN